MSIFCEKEYVSSPYCVAHHVHLLQISVYLDAVRNGCLGWPASTITDGPPDIENITQALETGPYGACVYESNNDVVDHQVR